MSADFTRLACISASSADTYLWTLGGINAIIVGLAVGGTQPETYYKRTPVITLLPVAQAFSEGQSVEECLSVQYSIQLPSLSGNNHVQNDFECL